MPPSSTSNLTSNNGPANFKISNEHTPEQSPASSCSPSPPRDDDFELAVNNAFSTPKQERTPQPRSGHMIGRRTRRNLAQGIATIGHQHAPIDERAPKTAGMQKHYGERPPPLADFFAGTDLVTSAMGEQRTLEEEEEELGDLEVWCGRVYWVNDRWLVPTTGRQAIGKIGNV